MSLAPYKDLHKEPKGPGDARPTTYQVIKDQGLEGKLSDLVILITGATSGLGAESAKALHKTSAKIYITGRQMEKAEKVAREIDGGDEKNKVEVVKMELDSLDSIKAGAEDFLKRSNKLNVLITNAGVMACPLSRTKEGFEMQFGTNHLGHFYLFQLLKDTLIKSSTPKFQSRVVSLSSSGHRMFTTIAEDYNFNKPDNEYSEFKAYGQSKTANIHFANEIERRYGSQGLHGYSLHPGAIMTELIRHVEHKVDDIGFFQDPKFQSWTKSPEQGAATQVWAAVAKELEGKGGLYLDDVAVAEQVPDDPDYPAFYPGYAKHAYDEEAERRLWQDSLKMVGLSDDK